uniref:Jumonji domain-containing protein 4 n=1 Tax=Setaria digitata TaxID=48799 RepID=A0A915PY13_9BILA
MLQPNGNADKRHMEIPLVGGNIGKTTNNDGKCQKIRLKDYIEMMQKDNRSNVIGYAKDWHFQQDSGTSYDMYGLPSVLRFDWINNEVWSGGEHDQIGDYRFVYLGVKDTWTPFHMDVMSSYSWSANICGRKLWYFVPPGNEEYFRINRHTFLEDIRTAQSKWSDANVTSFIQEEGEIVFVPSNWYHQVHNLEDAVSINHNVINAGNVELLIELIIGCLLDVDRELADCRSYFSVMEYNAQCEKILAADIRLNLAQVSSLLELIIDDRTNDTDECWVCSKHWSLAECKKDTNCLEFMRSVIHGNCTCRLGVGEICDSCLHFMKKYEISVAAECLARIRHIKEERN